MLCALVAAPAGSIDPELSPTSDKKFFGEDYPADNRPAAKTRFEYPYPHFQNDDQYDKDYVKDENGDHGEWNAQMKYDSLRNKLKQEQDEAKAAAKREKQAQADYDSAHARYKDAAEKEKKAVELEKKMKGGGTSGDGKAGLPGTAGGAGGVASAAKHAEDEVTDLENCKKELAQARKNLKKLMDELEEARAKKADLDKLAGDAEGKEVAAMKVEAEHEKKVDKETEEHMSALKKYTQKVEEKEQMEKDLAAAEKKLRSIRRGQVDPGGGVYRTGGGGHRKSSAPASGPTALPSLLSVAVLLASWFAAP